MSLSGRAQDIVVFGVMVFQYTAPRSCGVHYLSVERKKRECVVIQDFRSLSSTDLVARSDIGLARSGYSFLRAGARLD